MWKFRTVSTRHLDHQGWDSQLHHGSRSLCLPCSPTALSLSACSSSSDDCHSWIIFYGPLSSCIAGFKRQKERGGGRMHGWMGRQEEWAAERAQCSGQWADVFHYRVPLSIQVWWRVWYHANDTCYHSVPPYGITVEPCPAAWSNPSVKYSTNSLALFKACHCVYRPAIAPPTICSEGMPTLTKAPVFLLT